MRLLLFYFILLLNFFSLSLCGQTSACPQVNAGPDVSICGGCTTLSATVQGTVGTSTYSVSNIPYAPYPFHGGTSVLINIDDTWSNVITLPFCFQFFGNTYSQLLIGSNALITFDISQANGYCQWPITAANPTNTNPMNSIMAPFHDIDPSVPVIGMPNSSSDINYSIYGTAPCRELVISWDSVALFNCTSLNASSQLVLHENTNIIDVFIREKTTCSAWNGGAAIEGIQNATGTIAYTVAGRNFPTIWNANNDGKRFMPTGAPNYTFAWLDPANNVISNSQTFVVCPTNTTTYTAQVTNQTCSGPIVVTDQITVTISPGNMTLAMSSTPSLCNNSTGTATATPTGTGPFTYNWQPAGQTTPTITSVSAGTYTCTVTDANGCSSTQTIIVTSSSSNTVTLTAQTNILCNGGTNGAATVTVSGGQPPYVYAWAPSGGNNPTANGLAAGNYTVTVTDANNCTSTQTVIITQPPALLLSITQVNIACFGMANGSATATVSGGTGSSTYLWQPAGQTTASLTGLVAGSYTCTITDANGCVTTQSITITQPNTLTSSIINVIHTACAQNNGSATASLSGGTAPFNYTWLPTGGNNATANGLASGTYSVSVIDANGCLISDSVTINSSSGTTASFTGIDTTGCAPICVQFTNTSPTSVSCVWNFGDNTSSTNCNETHCYTNAGTYSVNLIITDASGCIASVTHSNMVQVYPQPIANFNANPDTASELDPVIDFVDNSTNSNSWLWLFGDSTQSNSTLQNPSHTYNDTGAYMVTLIVSNSFGCADTITGEIYISPEYTFFSPNAFTPNGDRINDLFMPVGSGFQPSTFHMIIFDRWGNLIFESSDLYQGWNGHANEGKDIAQMDTYIWKVTFSDWLNKKYAFQGKVSLIK